ncbi:hypothetical protein ABZW30_19765 [Kitasatospora sp. NPDC004669]|uniref:hypothetical protein n=1 Tax=Kitasatospora sp. NPDC004669 TaxID=3154555 RepID=UPI0033AF0D12
MDTTSFAGSNGLTRRRMLGAALALGAAAPLGLASTSWASSPASPTAAPARLTLPAPTGPHPVGTVALHLRDASRPDRPPGPADTAS